MNKKRKVCFVIASRASYGRVKCLLQEIKKNKNLELVIIAAASLLLFRFGKAVDIIKKDGFKINYKINYALDGDTLSTQAKSTGLGIIELSSALELIKPDMVITFADRFETMATAISSTYLNIPLVHIQGGEISGNIDERVRHAITKLSDYHFPATKLSKKRIISMGENPKTVFDVGCPSIDLLLKYDLSKKSIKKIKFTGTGHKINFELPYIVILQHPVTTSFGEGFNQINETLNAVKKFDNVQKIILWPNIDAGNDDISKGIRVFRENYSNKKFSFIRNFSPEDYAAVINNSLCCIGNSSSFIRECSYLGVPSVIVGDRQIGREHAKNAIFVDYSSKKISDAIRKQIKKARYDKSKLYGDGKASLKIVKILEKIHITHKKNNQYFHV